MEKKALAEFMSTGKVKKLNLHTFKAITPCKKTITQKRKVNELVNETVYLKRMVMELERDGHSVELKEVLNHELHNYPPSIASMNLSCDRIVLRKGNKSSLLGMLKKKCSLTEWPPDIAEWKGKSGIVVDAVALVRSYRPFNNEQGDTYACRILNAVVRGTSYSEIHMVADRYDGNMESGISLKDASGCWDRRGHSQLEYSISSSHVIRNWDSILASNISKAHLLQLLYKQWSNLVHIIPDGVTVVLTGGFENRQEIRIVRNRNTSLKEKDKDDDIVKLVSSTQEEADTRLFMSIAAFVHVGCSRVVIKASDTDIVVLCVYVYDYLAARGLKELYMQTKDYFISIHQIIEVIDADEAKMLPLVHVLSECDTTSFFYGKNKKTFYAATYIHKADLARICSQLENDNISTSLIDQIITVTKSATIAAYHPQEFSNLNALRHHLYARKKNIKLLPPTDDAFRQHV